jgi:DegV family protein with EDD domain
MIRIVTDTTAALSPAEAQTLGVFVVPQIIVFGDQSFRDDSEIDTPGFLDRLKTDPNFPTTAAPAPQFFYPLFAEAVEKGDSVICIHPSSNVSDTVHSAQAAALEFPGADIHIIDTRTIAANLGTLTRLACQWIVDGLSVDKIVNNLYKMIATQRVYFLIDTLDHLYRGGRIGRARAIVGEALQIKPILSFGEGEVSLYEIGRTRRRALQRLVQIAIEQAPQGAGSRICIMHSNAAEDAETLARDLCAGLNVNRVPIITVSPATLVHTGPGGIGIGFFAADMI